MRPAPAGCGALARDDGSPGPKPGNPARLHAGVPGLRALRPTRSVPTVVLRNGVAIEDPLEVVLDFLKAYGLLDVGDRSRAASFGEADLRRANRGGARISAAEIAAFSSAGKRSSRA